MRLFKEVKALEQQMTAIRHKIHRHPELGKRLNETAALVKERLTGLGIPYEEICPCGIIGTLGKADGQCILLRADMDALPIHEETGLPYASEISGVMHACGHDCHTAMLLTAAAVLKRHESELDGRVVLMFQPDEEGTDGGGAKVMLEAGLMDKYRPNAAVMVHVNGDLFVNQLYLWYGVGQASCDRFIVNICGVGGHAARPDEAVNPILCGIKVAEAFGDIGRYELCAQKPTALTVCTFHSGIANNVIPETCTLTGTLRTFDEEQRHFCLKRMCEATETLGTAYRCRASMSIESSMPCNLADEKLVTGIHWLLENTLSEYGVEVLPFDGNRSMGSEDFAYIAQLVPACVVQVGCAGYGEPHWPLHHPKAVFHDEGLAAGAAAYAEIAVGFLNGSLEEGRW